MPRLVVPENDYRPVLAIPPGDPRLTVTVVIPVYNRPELLRRTLAGVSGQLGYPRDLISVVVADDGSEEDIASVVDLYLGTLDISIVRQDHNGYGAGRARNLGARYTSGEVLLFVDADCLPDPELVHHHMAWHQRADDLVVVGSRHHVDSSAVAAAGLAAGTTDIRTLALGPDPTPEDMAPEDWRRVFYRRTGRLCHGAEGFRAFLTGNSSVRRDAFMASGGFSEDFTRWGGEDTEMGYRLFTAGMLFIPEDRAMIFHQDQEETHPDDPQWRQAGRAANAELIASKIPHPFYRRPTHTGPFEVPKISVIVAPAAGRRATEVADQLEAQTITDVEIWFPLDPGAAGTDVESLRDTAGDSDTRVLRAIGAAKGEYIAIVSGAVALDRAALLEASKALDATPRAGLVTANTAATDQGATNTAWGFGGMPAFSMSRRRDWNKVIGDAATLTDAWAELRPLITPIHLDQILVTADDPAGTPPASIQPAEVPVPEPDMGDRFGTFIGRVRRKLSGESKLIPVRHIGDARSAKTIRTWAGTWARIVDDRSARAVLVAGAALDQSTWEAVRLLDHPRRERIAVGVTASDGPPDAWADFLNTCVAVGAATQSDADILERWGVANVVVSGHPADSADALALLDVVVEAFA